MTATAELVPTVFNFEHKLVRTFTDERNEPWFCANDVCTVLEYANSRQAIAKNCREKGVSKRDTLTEGGKQELTYINEGNLYRLIIKSRKSEAQRFETWVCDEVLPAIRKTGTYTLTISPTQQHELQVIAARRSQDSGKLRAEIWSRFDNHFRIARYSQLPASKFEEAKRYLEEVSLGKRPEPSFRIDSVTIECLPVLPKEDTTFSRKYGEAVLSALRVWFRESCSAPVSMEVFRGLDALERVLTRAATEMDEAALHLALAGKYLNRWRRSETKESPRELPTGKTPCQTEKRGATVGDPLVGVDLPLSTWKKIFRRLGIDSELSSADIERRLRELI